MDSSIRVLLQLCLEGNDPNNINEPYKKLKDSTENVNVGTDLYVICAEAACQFQKFEIAEDCINMYFKNSPPGNQYLCRAYICQAQLHAPTSTKNPAQIEKAVHYLLKAINFAKQNSRYYFLVYNASVLYWQFCHPFLKPNCKRFLAKTMSQVVKALDDVNDEDYEWRAQLMITLIECHIDAGRKDDAREICNMAAQFTKNNMPNLYKNVLALQIQYRLADLNKLGKELKTSPDLHLFFKIHRLKAQLESDEKTDVGQELTKYFKGLTGMSEKSGTSTEISDKSSNETLVRTSSPVAMEKNDRMKLVLELGKICMNQGFCKITSDCLEYVERHAKDRGINLESKFIQCVLKVKCLGNKQENYSQSIVQVRLQAIEKLEKYLMTSLRLGDPQVIQIGCVTMWNLCLPLLQPNLRCHVRKPLTVIADALESIDSLSTLLRCQIHTELAKCEEDEEQLELALTHLRKALMLDDDGVYNARLETSLTRLQLRSTLYTTPERSEDVAAMIIEQARTSSDSGTSKMKRASLVKAGNALAPDAFALVLESENEPKEPSKGKEPPSLLAKLAGRAEHFDKAVSKASGHLKRLGTQKDQERVRIWADLTKTARKQQIWDVARVAARFCLLYDDGRWSGVKEKQIIDDEGTTNDDEKSNEGRLSSGQKKSESKRVSVVSEEIKMNVEKDLLRIMAEIHLINAEAIVQFLKNQDVQLFDKPTPPTPELGIVQSRKDQLPAEDSPEWSIYRDWVTSLSQASIKGFQRAAEIGNALQEPWLVCNSAVYILNYTTHLLAQKRHRELVPIVTPIIQSLKLVGHSGEATLLCQLTNVLATGLMQPWYPPVPKPSKQSVAVPSPSKKDTKKDKSSGKPALKITTTGFDSDALAELKQALEHLDYALQVTNGNDPSNLVPISVRHVIIKIWVHCKQLLSQQIPKNLGHESDNPHSQGPMSRCLCAVEMLSVHLLGLTEFATAPSLQEVVRMLGNCLWSDDLVALEMWSRLTVLAYNTDNQQVVMECGNKALSFVEEKNKKKTNTNKTSSAFEHKQKSKQRLLYYASIVMGQSLIKNMKGQTEIRRDALVHFVNACRFGQLAKNYDLVIAAAKHYWNSALPLINESLERILLLEPLEVVLQCIADVADKSIGKDDEDEEEDDVESRKSSKTKLTKDKKSMGQRKQSVKNKIDSKSSKSSVKISEKIDQKKQGFATQLKAECVSTSAVSVYDEDLKMRASMYGVLFQAYADKGEWEQGLRAMDQAIKDMPRTAHRLLIFKHRVITKSKLGQDVQFDMGKFKNENELVVSSMWHHVAMNSANPREQLVAYQNCIDVLQEPQSDWQKVDYLLEFGEWLFFNEFPINDAIDQFMWATDILMNKSANEEQCLDNEDGVTDQQVSSPTNFIKSIDLHSIFDVRTLEYLARTHIMLAQLVGRKSSKFVDYCVFAVACVQRIWKVTLDYVEKVPREAPKPGDTTPTKKGNKEKCKEPSNVKQDKSTGKTCYPSTLHAWATFELPDKFTECLPYDESRRMISATSFVCPAMSVYYLNALVDDLCCLGYNHFALPITSLLGCLAKHVIKNELLLKFVHLRVMEICQDLRLVEEAIYHEMVAAKENENDENEIAKSREEIELWEEKQRQVKAEEARLFNNNDVTTGFSSPKEQVIRCKLSTSGTTINERNNWMKYKTRITGIERRHVWVKIAAIFIKQGHYQSARKLLNEASTSALVFEDIRCRAHVLYHLAVLAFYESNSQKAMSLLQEVQSFNGDHSFWLKTILLLVDAICDKRDRCDVEGVKLDSKAKDKAITLLKQSLDVLTQLSQYSSNKTCMTDYVVATLKAKLGNVLTKETLGHDVNEETLNEAFEYLQTSETLLGKCGYSRETIKVKCERAVLLRCFAARCQDVTRKRELYLEALNILKHASELCNSLLNDIQAVSSLEQLPSVSLPVEVDVIETRLCLGELTVEIMNEHTKDERLRRNNEARKGSVEKLIDEFVQDEPEMTEEEKKWHFVTRTIAEDTLTNLTVIFSRCSSIPFLKTKCYLVLGYCLRTLATHLNPDDEPQWSVVEQVVPDQPSSNITQTSNHSDTENNDFEEVGTAEEPSDTSKDFQNALRQAEVAKFLKDEYKDCLRTLAQAVECLVQCVQLGIKHGFTELVADASYHLVGIFGRHDMRSATLYLALFQSCSMSLSLLSLLRRCLLDSSLSRLAALMKQREMLCQKFLYQDAASSVLAANSQALAEFEAWRRINISKNHLDLAKELSTPNTLYLVLQHSKDKSYLYGAVLEKPRSGLTSAKSTKQSGNTAAPPIKSVISRSKVDHGQLNEILKKFDHFKSAQASELIRQNYLRRQAEEKRKMLATVDNDGFSNTEDVLQNDITVKENEKNLEKQFHELTKKMEDYLAPILEQLKPALNENAMPETLVIFADQFLLRLPLESLSILKSPQLQCVARDLSLQIHHHRLHSLETSGTDSKQDNKKMGQAVVAGKKGGKGDKPPTAKSQDKKGDKKTSKDQGCIPKDGIPVDISGLRYIVDPFNECFNKGDDNPEKVFNDIVAKYKTLSGKWGGLVGKDRVASVGEWQKLMIESTSFMFYGTQKCLNYIPPWLLAPLSLPDCNVMLILDQVETNDSFLRQGVLDVTKTSSELALALPFESAALLSLAGVNCVISNQWNCTSKENKEKLIKIMEASLDENKNIGCALRKYAKSCLETTPVVEPSAKQDDEPVQPTSGVSHVDHEVQDRTYKQVISKNTVLYGVPYFMFNPQKV